MIDEALQDHCLADATLRRPRGGADLPRVRAGLGGRALRAALADLEPAARHMSRGGRDREPDVPVHGRGVSSRERNAVGDALRACLSRYSGPMGTEDVDVMSPDESDDVETAVDGSERRLFVRRLDFEVWHGREPVR